jgi:hypothetical protein
MSTLNIPLLRQVQAAIMTPPPGTGFGMAHFQFADPECGTVCCIAGMTTFIASPGTKSGHADKARNLLGLTYFQANDLFSPCCDSLYDITAQEASDTIDRLIETGEVVWENIPNA